MSRGLPRLVAQAGQKLAGGDVIGRRDGANPGLQRRFQLTDSHFDLATALWAAIALIPGGIDPVALEVERALRQNAGPADGARHRIELLGAEPRRSPLGADPQLRSGLSRGERAWFCQAALVSFSR